MTRSVSSLTTHSMPTTAPASSRSGLLGERVVGLLRIAGPLQEQQQGLVPGRLSRGQHGADARADVVPDLRPHFAGRSAQRPRVLAAEGVAPVGGVAEKR